MIYLLKDDYRYLIDLLKRQPQWWVRDKLIEKIEDDKNRKELTKKCKHTFGKYIGEKECCKKCAATGVGMEQHWNLVQKVISA